MDGIRVGLSKISIKIYDWNGHTTIHTHTKTITNNSIVSFFFKKKKETTTTTHCRNTIIFNEWIFIRKITKVREHEINKCVNIRLNADISMSVNEYLIRKENDGVYKMMSSAV